MTENYHTPPVDGFAGLAANIRVPLGQLDAELTAQDGRLDAIEADSGWIYPTLLNSWVDFGSGYGPTRYRKTNGVVELQIMVKSGTIGTDIMTLPAGYRPSVLLPPIICNSNDTVGRMSITNTGAVTAQAGVNTWFAALVRFIPEA